MNILAPVPRLLVCLAALSVLAACGGEDAADPPAQEQVEAEVVDPTTVEYSPELDIDFAQMERTRRGVYFRDDETGSGAEAADGSTVVVNYTGFLSDGEMFESSAEEDAPLEFELGAQEVIPGFDEGLRGMREGGRRTLVIPPQLAYGAQSVGDGQIPPNSVLVFEVQLVEVR
ncbi:MAG: FKBP-type peptidyl-prolyl cis-trans isomerase [Gemmatimonadota bacterium]